MQIKVSHEWVNTIIAGLGLMIAVVLAAIELVPSKDRLELVEMESGPYTSIGSEENAETQYTWYLSFYNPTDRDLTVVDSSLVISESDERHVVPDYLMSFKRIGDAEELQQEIVLKPYEFQRFFVTLTIDREPKTKYFDPLPEYRTGRASLRLTTADGSALEYALLERR